MSVQRPADRRAKRVAVISSLALVLAVDGCSIGSNNSAGGSAGQAAPIPSATPITSTSPPSSTTTSPGFKQDPVDSGFAQKLAALCNDWNSFASSHQYPVGPNPQAATREMLPKIGAWMDSLPINHELVARARSLGAPATGTVAWAHVLESFTQYQESVTSAAAAAKAADLQAWQTSEVAWSAARDNVREDLLKAGIGAQSSCSLPFIRPSGHGD
jgi:hypothetical protein